MTYFPHTDQDREEMLRVLGHENIEDLFSWIPDNIRLGRDLELDTLALGRRDEHRRAGI